MCARNEIPSFGLLSLLLLLLLALGSTEVGASDYELIIDKSARRMMVVNGTGITKRYWVALGRGGRGDKMRMGDYKTPVGSYRIVNFKQNSDYYFFMQLNYPNVKDAFYGLKNHTISRGTFDTIVDALNNGSLPPQDTRLGGYIGIHGIGEITDEKLEAHAMSNWTDGCVALTNDEIAELRHFVTIGTKVTIRE
jgi:murein L,D-transpeptidase YafK